MILVTDDDTIAMKSNFQRIGASIYMGVTLPSSGVHRMFWYARDLGQDGSPRALVSGSLLQKKKKPPIKQKLNFINARQKGKKFSP